MKTVTFATALADVDAIKTSIATVAEAASYSGGALNGVIGAATMTPARTLTVKSAANTGSYVVSSTVTITGTDAAGRTQSEIFTITNADGGETLVGTKGFKTVVSIAIQAQADTGGAFEFGVRDILLDKLPYAVRAVAAGDLKVGYADSSTDIIPALAAKETVSIAPTKIFGDASTTVVGMTLYFA